MKYSIDWLMANDGFECTCGKHHYGLLKDCIIGENALMQLPRILHKYNVTHPFLLCDTLTYAAAGEQVTALLENEDDTALYLGRANIYFEKGDYEAAISDYDYYLNEWKDAVAFGNRGYCHFVLENLDAALEDLDSCIELKDDYAWAYYTRGQILQAQEKFEEAKEDYEKANSLMESNE